MSRQVETAVATLSIGGAPMGDVQRPDTIPMMGLFDLFRRPSRLSSARTFRLPEDGFMRVVGESHYQATLRRSFKMTAASASRGSSRRA